MNAFIFPLLHLRALFFFSQNCTRGVFAGASLFIRLFDKLRLEFASAHLREFHSGLPVVGFLPRFSRINRCRYLIPLSHKGEFRLSKMYLANFR